MQSARITLFASLAWLLSLAAIGCGDDAPGEQTVSVDHDDAGSEASDAGGPAAARDDAGLTVISVGETVLCSFEASDAFTGPSELDPGVLGSAGSARGFGQVFRRRDGTLFVRAIPLDGPANEERAVIAAGEAPASATLVAGERDFVLGYRAGKELRLKGLGDASTAVVTLTQALEGEAYALTATQSGYAVAFRSSAGDELELRSFSAQLELEQSAVVTLPGSAGLGLAPLGERDLLLGFTQSSASAELSASGLRLDAMLGAVGASELLSKSPPSRPELALAGRKTSVGLLYEARDGDVREALKLRRIDEAGAAEGPLLNLADAPRRVSSGAIAAFGQGFAVVYRELPSPGTRDEAIRIAFVNQYGSVIYDAQLASRLGAQSRTSLAVSGARVLASVLTGSSEGSELRTLRLDCPGALVLCGGPVD